MKPLRSLSILIPAYNDGSSIQTVVEEAQLVAQKNALRYEIIVVNDASGDNTRVVLSRLAKRIKYLRVITHEVNLGYGATIKELYYAGIHEWLFTIPGDYQVGAKELAKLLPLASQSDMIIGWRTDRSDSQARKHQSKIYNSLLQLFLRMPVHDANSVRLMKRQVMQKIRLTSTSAFVDAELVLRAKKAGFDISEAEIIHRERARGTQGGGGRLATILPTILDMILFFIKYL